MSQPNRTISSDLLVRLQQGIPLVPRPFARIGAELNQPEDAVLETLQHVMTAQQARRFGAIFDSAALGFRTTLCTADVGFDDLDDAGRLVGKRESVTHCYSRVDIDCLDTPRASTAPRLWFTVAAPGAAFDDEMQAIRELLSSTAVYELPAVRRYKVGVVLNPESGRPQAILAGTANGVTSSDSPVVIDLDDSLQRRIVHALQGTIPLTPTPFETLSERCGCDAETLLTHLRTWQQAGALRRIALILHHRRAGFRANAMCVWPVPEQCIDTAGLALAELATVTHCYSRARCEVFPYNLYAMMHADTWKSVRAMFQNASERLGLTNGRMLCSDRQYCKTSLRYVPQLNA